MPAPSEAMTPDHMREWVVVENDGAYVKDPDLATLRIEERGTPAEMVVLLVVTDVKPLKETARQVANLAAAAPALLKALKLLLARQEQSLTVGVLPADWGIARETARQAIALAEQKDTQP